MPDALVATQPPKELNSIESGSCPVQYPFSANCQITHDQTNTVTLHSVTEICYHKSFT